MQQIINFIIRHKTFLLFFLLFLLGIAFTINSHSYHKSKFINSANFLTGGVYNSFNNLSIYFKLKSQNNLLQEENNHLETFYSIQNTSIIPCFQIVLILINLTKLLALM